jgi:hypothetical protein
MAKARSTTYLLVVFLCVVLLSLLVYRYVLKETFADNYDANCWNDKAERAVGSDFTRIDKDNIQAINKECMNKAIQNKDTVFAIQDNNQCFTGKGDGYKKYGRATECGEGGGAWKQRVYKIGRKYMPTNYEIPLTS